MSIEADYSTDSSTLVIRMDNKFDFSKVQDFRRAYSQPDDEVKTIVVDLKQTEYMDSSALGMLLNMQKTFEGKNIDFEIIHCQEQVLRILKISRFDKKFTIR
jgi:anti-anti-sigma factor